MDRGKVGIFLGYSDRTDHQCRVYTPDTGSIIRATTVTFNEEVQGVVVGLHQKDRLKTQAQQVDNTIPIRKPVGRPPQPILIGGSVNQAENEGLGNHSEPNLQLESEHNLKPDDTIDVELPAESEAGPSLPTTRKFLHVEVPTLKRNRPDDKEIDMPNPKHVRALMAYIAELENKVESVHHVDIRIPIPKTYQEAINDPVFAEEWKDAMDLELRALISNST